MIKKIILSVLVIVMLCSVSVSIADVDISGLSYEELVFIVNEAQMLMMKTDKWQRVEVPSGMYLIGRDIPEGYWTISALDASKVRLTWGTKTTETGMDIEIHSRIAGGWIYSKNYKYYEAGNDTFASWELKEGQYLLVEDGVAVFTPYTGNSFTFK